ncbi:uncharacterized protein L3040_000136 [Drepanopeziza brunnea f. sp. 'multigermtubi']|uniref:uncharacterized protein n=1 Tax=Drepanopeziza brunnea f. sp. 'multigermtubi' TaxID=698441 RepID=UPI0023A30B40|nr:hypothetical protein L3040_000136 [Drepanopeziza brunnea f. sp. 'multigermtubi']
MPPSLNLAATPAEDFPMFSRLAPELRVKILRQAVLEEKPRTIYLFLMPGTSPKKLWRAYTSSNIALMSVSREARSEAINLYQQPFGISTVQGQSTAERGPLHVDLAKDLIYLSAPERMEGDDPIVIAEVFESVFDTTFTIKDFSINLALDFFLAFFLHIEVITNFHEDGPLIDLTPCKMHLLRGLTIVADTLSLKYRSRKMVIGNARSARNGVAVFAENLEKLLQLATPMLSQPVLQSVNYAIRVRGPEPRSRHHMITRQGGRVKEL